MKADFHALMDLIGAKVTPDHQKWGILNVDAPLNSVAGHYNLLRAYKYIQVYH